jgi:putative ABC transport system ATP-binding protein
MSVAANGTAVVLALRDVVKEYPTEPPTKVLRGINLTVTQGELLAVVGPSGSGKSTLLNIIGTLDRPSSGEVDIVGHSTASLTDAQLSAVRSQNLGFVFQQFFLLSGQSSLDNVADGLLYRGIARKSRREAAAAALHRVGLSHRFQHAPAALSGGERQRVAIARALVGEPEILLADEPTGNLDSVASANIMELLHELHRAGTTIIVITHDQDIARSLPRQVLVRDGQIEFDSAMAEMPK